MHDSDVHPHARRTADTPEGFSSSFIYQGNRQAYLAAEGRLFGDVILQAILDAGMVYPPVGGAIRRPWPALRAIVDGLRFLFDAKDRRRYYVGAAAGIDADSLDRMLRGLLDPEVVPEQTRGGVTKAIAERIRARVVVHLTKGMMQ